MDINEMESVENEEKIIQQLLSQLSNADPQHSSNVEETLRENNVKLQDPPNVDEILATDAALISPTSHNVSVINAACQEILKQMEYQLVMLLKKNRKEQDIILTFLSSNCKNQYSETFKKTCIKCAGFPYFKDFYGFQPPPNEDVLRKQKNNKLLPIDFIKSYPTWNSNDAKTLINAIKKYENATPSSVDWMKISATDMEGKYSASECQSKWSMHLDPKINKSRWSLKEMDLLKTISAKYNYQDWDKIAAELGTKRTGLQCCTQYHTHTFPTEGKWTKEEDETLKNLVEKYRIKDYIPWSKVVWYFENRSLKQCQERYAYHLGNIKKGNFTMEEDFVIVYLASKLKNFGEVAKFLPKRVSTQIRSRYEYLVKLSMPEFTQEEDELLTKLMVQYPRNWGKISENFKNRSRVQCRKRWAHLQKSIRLENDYRNESENYESVNSTPENSAADREKSEIDAKNVGKNIHLLSKPAVTAKKYPETYKKLLDYHKYCHKFLFGPKPRFPINSEELKNLTVKMRVTMKSLSISHAGVLSEFNIDSLSNNCEFNTEDTKILSTLDVCSREPGDFELSKNIIPPNYMTLVALRTFMLGWNEIKNLFNFYEDLPRASPNPDTSSNRILFSDAKKLFKSRMKSIFAFPFMLSNISPVDRQKPVYKPKARKSVKPLSKLKRKEHAKLMSAAYKKKLKLIGKELEDSNNSELVSKDESGKSKEEVNKKKPKGSLKNVKPEVGTGLNERKTGRKRIHSFETEREERVAPLKKRATRNSSLPNS